MKQVFIFCLVFLSFLSISHAQQATPTATDTTTVRFIVKFTPRQQPIATSTNYQISGDVDDPISMGGVQLTGANVQTGMFFADGNGQIFQITASSASDPLNITVRPLDNQMDPNYEMPTSAGVIYRPTPNLLLPQWVVTMNATTQNALLSHMANMIDLKLAGVNSPSIQIRTGSYALASSDDTVLFNISSTATASLPAPNTATGKTYKIGKVDENSATLNFSPALRLSPNTTITSLNYARTFLIQSTGTEWWVVSQY